MHIVKKKKVLCVQVYRQWYSRPVKEDVKSRRWVRWCWGSGLWKPGHLRPNLALPDSYSPGSIWENGRANIGSGEWRQGPQKDVVGGASVWRAEREGALAKERRGTEKHLLSPHDAADRWAWPQHPLCTSFSWTSPRPERVKRVEREVPEVRRDS